MNTHYTNPPSLFTLFIALNTSHAIANFSFFISYSKSPASQFLLGCQIARMVVLSQKILENYAQISSCKFPTTPTTPSSFCSKIPTIDFTDPDAKNQIVEACSEFGFFKLINHGVPMEDITKLENEAYKFFNLPQDEKEKACPANPFGYGKNRIGVHGDVGWIEYLLFGVNPRLVHHKPVSVPGNSEFFRSSVQEYVSAVGNMAHEVLEMIAEGLKIEPRNVLSRLVRDEKSDTFFRINHYPPCQELQALRGRNLIGFGEHTDPQVISVVRSNNASGLQILLKDGTWVSVPPDQNSMFILVGDSLQVMTNGRFRSVKHRVVADGKKSRLSMIFFGGPPLNEKIAPLSSVMVEGEESFYKELTWCEFKKAANKTRVSDNRLKLFEKPT